METLGLYPTFYVPWIGSAWVMGIIGVIHVVASHTSVGAAFLFALLETKAYREGKPQLMDFIRRYGMFLLVFSYIIGSITGPGIWYAITIASPRGVGGLIHNFVWVWAAEWVYFTVEVIGVYALVYLIGKVDAKTHLKLTWSFALASWATMLLIVGILSFMMWRQRRLVPDRLYQRRVLQPELLRASGHPHRVDAGDGDCGGSDGRQPHGRRGPAAQRVRFLAPIGLTGGLFSVMMFLYYLQTLPGNAKVMLDVHLLPVYANGMIAVFVATTLYLIFAWLQPLRVGIGTAVAMFLFVGIVGVWPEERMRESMRKPYVAGQYIYSNQIIARDVPGKGIVAEVDHIAATGWLKSNPFVPERLRIVTDENRLEAGELLAKMACANCHALERGAPLRSLPDKFHGSTDADLIAAFLRGPLKHGTVPYMPRIDLPDAEVDALAAYLASVNAAGPGSAAAQRPPAVSSASAVRAGISQE